MGSLFSRVAALTLLAVLMASGLLACGGDDDAMEPDASADGSSPGLDAGSMDAGTAVVDAGGDAGPEFIDCDPYTAGSCPDGEKCSLVIEGDEETGDSIGVYFGCLPGERAKGLLAPCVAFDRDRQREPRLGGDIAAGDDCQQGLFCSNRNRPSNAPVCQPICGGGMSDCGQDGFCSLISTEPRLGLCRTASNCDPVFQTGCAPGQACYPLNATNGDLVGECFDWEPAEGSDGAPGSPCQFIDQCQPGSTCRPVSDTETRCVELCSAGPGFMPDAGMPMDAGMPDAGTDGGVDAGDMDAGDMDAGDMDAGDMDAGDMDAGDMDAGDVDAGDMDAGDMDAGDVDAGDVDAGDMDAGPVFMGTGECTDMSLSCVMLDLDEMAEFRTATAVGLCTSAADDM